MIIAPKINEKTISGVHHEADLAFCTAAGVEQQQNVVGRICGFEVLNFLKDAVLIDEEVVPRQRHHRITRRVVDSGIQRDQRDVHLQGEASLCQQKRAHRQDQGDSEELEWTPPLHRSSQAPDDGPAEGMFQWIAGKHKVNSNWNLPVTLSPRTDGPRVVAHFDDLAVWQVQKSLNFWPEDLRCSPAHNGGKGAGSIGVPLTVVQLQHRVHGIVQFAINGTPQAEVGIAVASGFQRWRKAGPVQIMNQRPDRVNIVEWAEDALVLLRRGKPWTEERCDATRTRFYGA